MTTTIEGILPALLTPYDKDGNVDKGLLVQLTDRLLEQGANGFFICGTTAEFPFLTVPEREMIAETVLETVAGRVPVVVHVGTLQPADVKRLASHAAAAGASAVSAVPPFYYSYDSEAILDYIGDVASATDLPFFYYHIPPRTGVDVDLGTAELLARIPNVIGMKDSGSDLIYMRELLEVCGPDFAVFCGRDELLLPALLYGAKGGVGSTYNFLLPHSRAIWEGFKAGDFSCAQEAQSKANRIMNILTSHSNIAATKEVLRLCGLDIGEPRKPQMRLTPPVRKAIAEALDGVGLWDIKGLRSEEAPLKK